MTTYSRTNNAAPRSCEYGNASVFADQSSVTAALIAADIINPVKIPAGTRVSRVVVKNTDMDTNGTPALTAKIGFAAADGSAMPSGADTAVSADAAFGQAAATTTYEIFPPYVVEKDAFLSIVVGTGAATGAAGTVYAKVEGETLGAK